MLCLEPIQGTDIKTGNKVLCKQNQSISVMLSEDMLLPLWSSVSCSSLFFMIFISGSTGINVNNVVMLHDVMHSPPFSLIFFICFTISLVLLT